MHEDQKETQHWPKEAWDAAGESPIIEDEQKPRKCLTFIQIITCTFMGLLVFGLAFLSKASLLLLISLCNEKSTTIETKVYALLFIGCLLIAPNVLLLIKSIWKITFKDSKTPSTQTLLWIISVETLVAVGSSILTLVAMPRFDILTNVMLLNGIAILSAILQVVGNAIAHGRKRFTATSVAAVFFLLAGFCLFAVNYLKQQNGKQNMALFVGLAIGGTFLVSMNWWENYALLFRIVFFQNTVRDIKRSHNFVNIVASLVRIIVTFTVLGAYVKLSGQDWSSVLSVTDNTKTVVLSLFALQVLASAVCRYVAVAACKMHAVRRSFVTPMIFTSPATLGAFVLAIWIPFLQAQKKTTFAEYCTTFDAIKSPALSVMKHMLTDLTHDLCEHIPDEGSSLNFGLLGSSLISWWIGLVLCTLYIWFLNTQRIARTKDLFVRNLYEAAFIDQSMLLNTKFDIVPLPRCNRETEKMTIYLCATMWHETRDEMLKMIISMFRLDKFRPKKNRFNDVVFESHIYFDDAFLTKNNNRRVNEYAETLVEVIKEVYLIFTEDSKSAFRERKPLPAQKIFQTPYGCRLQYTLPHGNTLFVHFKDKQQIRHKKRWSQIMYMYYLLGWKLNKKYFEMYKQKDVHLPSIEEQLKKAKANTYLLALDGDTDFQPSAVMLLVDRLKLYPEVGAACGRIHPTGTGPMVWYQKFEYAVGHWLQKTAEHVFGSVLCSPGCFSLMRAEALMSDNVMKRYTTKATEASHYLQYDQGEDRWLCTLLLQQGWRVEYNAASDSYTNAPQEFKEFYNQRRRWGPSTMANTLDLLSTGSITARLNKSISRPYILYQTITMAASILSPATVCLMIAGSLKTVLKIDANGALAIAVIPPAIYLFLCYYLGQEKSNLQITIAAIMSIIYAFLMTATIFTIIADMVIEETFFTPSGLFFIGLIIMYVGTALLHPHEFHLIIYGFLYFICIPSGYLLLSIYSIVNMNNVSWGTRESANQSGGPDQNLQKNVKCQKLFKICGYNLEIQVNKEEKVMCTVPENAPQAIPLNVVNKVPTQPKEVQLPLNETFFIEQLTESSGELPLNQEKLNAEEEYFWKDLIEKYLKPLVSDKKKEEAIKEDLKDLRDKAAFVFFICNLLWIVATFFLQVIGSPVNIPIPKMYPNGTVDPNEKIFIDPIGLMFLLSFASLLVVQFLAMLWHRVQTLIHFIAYTGTEAVVNRKARNSTVIAEISEENNFL
ncbi:chitin synthase chs-2-like isoform X1 [Neoarius graeffei]|uniref:chitin synthase chs-2-like isoform X1 n=1 Tax=Neoarius graeffei TaxID=443677 RepID=UPI00298C12DB|nr:chitin synthase chs-2-like isoform X1 [Neoarius graeffei]